MRGLGIVHTVAFKLYVGIIALQTSSARKYSAMAKKLFDKSSSLLKKPPLTVTAKDLNSLAKKLLRHRARASLVIGAFFLASVGAAAIAAVLQADSAERWVRHTLEAETLTNSLLASLANAETAVSSYVITGEDGYLERFKAAKPALGKTLASLQVQTSDNPSQQARLLDIGSEMRSWLAEADQFVSLAREGKRTEAAELVKTQDSERIMDRLHAMFAEFARAEERLLGRRRLEARRDQRWLLIFIGIGFVMSTALSFFFIRSMQSSIAEIEEKNIELESEARLRRATEDTLRQSQKMDAVGHLAGGIAHDFNNLLTIIMGNLDTIQRRTQGMDSTSASTLARPLDAALKGARSAAKLTHRLLAFSRQQALEPMPLDVNAWVAGMSELLQRTVGETIQIETVLAGGLWRTFTDGNQLESALVNLVVNARDALPSGGSITIETANAFLDEAYAARFGDVKAGQYVQLSVTDNGIGIPAKLMDRIFEPFFTTKMVGEGTGLGLAMVHGFVKQSHGHIRVYSEEGQGTTVKIYLPRLTSFQETQAFPVALAAEAAETPRAREGETILLVEDNAGVREYAVSVLEDLGYRVLEAADADAALSILAGGRKPGLLFTDVVLPGKINGRELAEEVLKLQGSIAVLFSTGFTRNAIVHHGRLDTGVHLIHKPYTQQELARKVRELLDQRNPVLANGNGHSASLNGREA
jgi:signal transduction histidine kinase